MGNIGSDLTTSVKKSEVLTISENENDNKVISLPPSLMTNNLQISLIIVCILLVISTLYLYNKKC